MDEFKQGRRSGADAYQCPGQAYTIDRAAHLARLTSFYPGCLDCAQRHDAEGLLPVQLREWSRLEARKQSGAHWTAEALAGSACGDVDAALAGRLAAALAVFVREQTRAPARSPAVVVGSDGHWASADGLSEACRALRRGGCRALEAGAVTSPALAIAAHRMDAAAALWIGNSSGAPHATSIKLWGRGGRPWSSPGTLDDVRRCFETQPARAARGGGNLMRCDAASGYLAALEELFHALRPLAIVLDTACAPLGRYWQKLTAQTACRGLPPGRQRPDAGDGEHPLLERRLAAIGREVVASGAHLGAWIDGDGETCHVVDEHGQRVDGATLLGVLADSLHVGSRKATVLLEADAGGEASRRLERQGARVVRGTATRQAACEQMEASGAVLGGGSSGRFWFAGPPPVCDALAALSLLAACLSQSDRGLSEVLDAARAAE